MKKNNNSADYSSETNTFKTKSIYGDREFACTLDSDANLMDVQLCERHEYDIQTGKGISLDNVFGPLADSKSIDTKTVAFGENNIKFMSCFTCENSKDVVFLLNGNMDNKGLIHELSIDITGDKRTVKDDDDVEKIASVYSEIINCYINFQALDDIGKIKNEGPRITKNNGQ